MAVFIHKKNPFWTEVYDAVVYVDKNESVSSEVEYECHSIYKCCKPVDLLLHTKNEPSKQTICHESKE